MRNVQNMLGSRLTATIALAGLLTSRLNAEDLFAYWYRLWYPCQIKNQSKPIFRRRPASGTVTKITHSWEDLYLPLCEKNT